MVLFAERESSVANSIFRRVRGAIPFSEITVAEETLAKP